MSASDRIVISVPPRELARCDLPGSLFPASRLLEFPISEPLRLALSLIPGAIRQAHCLVRPEIFTHGVSRAWLDVRLGAIREHLCLSDGTSIKVIEGLENHVFLYGLCWHRGHIGIRNLSRRAPELFTHIRSQINTFHSALVAGRVVRPPTRLLMFDTPRAGPLPEFHAFFLNRHSMDLSINRIVEHGAVPAPRWNQWKNITYIPLTESGARSAAFSREAARLIAKAYMDASRCVVIRLPFLGGGATLQERLAVLLAAVRDTGRIIPHVHAMNVLLLTEDIPEELLNGWSARTSLLLDETFDFWRHTKAFYAQRHRINFLLLGKRARAPNLLRGLADLFGRVHVERHGRFVFRRVGTLQAKSCAAVRKV
jgi:hypothetical protein